MKVQARAGRPSASRSAQFYKAYEDDDGDRADRQYKNKVIEADRDGATR